MRSETDLMHPWRRHPLFLAVCVACGLIVIGEVVGLVADVAAARTERRRLDRAAREWRALTAVEPSPTPENGVLIATELERGRKRLAELEEAWQGEDWTTDDSMPSQRAEAFFDLAAFAERMRELARRMKVGLRSDESFGFGAYRQEAPAVDELGWVFQERRMLGRLLETLFAARPVELRSVQRERPPLATTHAAHAMAARTAGVDKDLFTFERKRAGPSVETTSRGFRLVFLGDTAVLRGWLNGMVEAGLPVLVRSIEVAPVEPPRVTVAETSAPVVARAPSQFTVVVEVVELPALSA